VLNQKLARNSRFGWVSFAAVQKRKSNQKTAKEHEGEGWSTEPRSANFPEISRSPPFVFTTREGMSDISGRESLVGRTS
jgi:hypothetical protein